MNNKILDIKYNSLKSLFLPRFGNENHIRIVKIIGEIGKLEKKKTATKQIIELKEKVVWLLEEERKQFLTKTK